MATKKSGKHVIALDIGGTKIIGGLLGGNKILKKIKVRTQAAKGKRFVINQVCRVISLLSEGINKKKIAGIGIGMPGPLNPASGTVYNTPNLPGWKNVPLKNILEKKFKIKVRIDNDTNCAALAESKYFNSRNLLCITLGTGVGGGIIIDAKIYHGKGFAGELGHMVVKADGPGCHCGNHGCLEEYISGRGIKRISKRFFNKELEPKHMQDMAEAGNKKAAKVYEEAGKWLGVGLANLANIFDPEIIVLGGSISRAGNLILKPAVKEMKKRAFDTSVRDVRVVVSRLGEDAGLLGAAALIL